MFSEEYADWIRAQIQELMKPISGVSRIEILEGRVRELEKVIANAPKSMTAEYKVTVPAEDAEHVYDKALEKQTAEDEGDARTERIFEIIGAEIAAMNGLKIPEMWKEHSPVASALKRGIRKALNEFYRGPVNNDSQARIIRLLQSNAGLIKANDELRGTVDKLLNDRSVLMDRLQKARDVLDEFPDEQEKPNDA